jgi:hypothetical protein
LEGNDARILNQSDVFTLSFYYKSNITATLPVQIYNRTSGNSTWTIWRGVSVIGNGEWHRAELTFTKNTAVAADPKTGTSWGFIVGMNFELGTDYVNISNENVWQNNGSVKGPNFGLCGSLNNYIRITGMQVEVGDTATPFEHRSYGEELSLCQRYYQSIDYYYDYGSTGVAGNVFYYTNFSFPVTMRATPAMTASQWGQNTGNAETRYTATYVDGWIMQSAIPTGCLMRGNHGNIYNAMLGRGKFDAEL